MSSTPDPTAQRPPASEPAAVVPFPAGEPVLPDGGMAVVVTPRSSDLVGDSLPRVIRRIAIPAVASNLMMTLFATVDAFWVGTRIGPQGLAAVSTSIFWIWVVVSIAEMASVGLTAVAARRHGERRPGDAAAAVGDGLRFSLGLGAVVAVAGALAVDALFAAMQTPQEVTVLGRSYLQTYLIGAPLIFGYFCVDAAFRASGDTRTPLALLSTATIATLILDPILILGLGGAPKLGIAGAAIALLATRGTAFIIGLTILGRRGMVRFAPIDWSMVRRIVRIGLPTATTGVMFSLIYVGMTRTTTQFGTPALAALGLGHRIESWLYMVGVGFGAGAAAIVGQNLGAGRPDRARRAGWVTLGYAAVPSLAMAIVSLVLPELIAGVFTNDPTVVEETARYLRINAIAQLVLCGEIVLEGALGGAGDTLPPMLTSTTLTLLRLPLAVWAAHRWGADGIWWVISLTAVGRAVAMMLLWRSGHWERRSV